VKFESLVKLKTANTSVIGNSIIDDVSLDTLLTFSSERVMDVVGRVNVVVVVVVVVVLVVVVVEVVDVACIGQSGGRQEPPPLKKV